jgi:hypothetical protein
LRGVPFGGMSGAVEGTGTIVESLRGGRVGRLEGPTGKVGSVSDWNMFAKRRARDW